MKITPSGLTRRCARRIGRDGWTVEMPDPLVEAAQRMRTAAHINRCFARSVELGTLEADEPKSADYYNGKADAYAETAQHLETRNA